MREARLGDVVVSMKNGLYKPATEYADDGTPCLRMYNIDAGAIVWRDIKRMRVSAAELEEYGLQEGDLLVNRVNSRELVGKAAYIPSSIEPSVFESKNIRVRLDRSKALPKFVNYQLLAGGRRHFSGNAQQVVGMASINQKQLAGFPIVLTDLEEQRRIVAALEEQFSRLDEAIADLKRVRANLKRYKAAVLKAAVEGRLVPTEAELASREGRRYETGSQLLDRVLQERRRAWNGRGTYRDADAPEVGGLPPLPEGWTWARLEAVAALKGGITVDKKRRDPTSRPVPYLRVANVQRGYLDLDEIKDIKAPEADIDELRLYPGDILFNEGGDRDKLGRGWIWEGQLPECIHQNHVFRARLYLVDLSGKLISWWGNTFGKDYFLREGKQTTNLASINMTKLSAFPVPIPPLAEQRRIVAEVDRRLSLLAEAEHQVECNLSRAHVTRVSLLSKAFGSTL